MHVPFLILFVAYLQHQSVHPALFYDTTIGLLKQKAMSCYLIRLKLSITDDALFDGLMLFLNVTVEHNKTSLTILNGLSTKGYSFPGGFEMLINCFRFFFSFVPFFACRNKSNFQIFGFVLVLGEVVTTEQSTVLILIIFFTPQQIAISLFVLFICCDVDFFPHAVSFT